MASSPRLADTVVLVPVRSPEPVPAELADHVGSLAAVAEVVVLDGSPPAVRAANAARLPAGVRAVGVPVPPPGHNGKVVAVRHGLRVTTAGRVVVADDDVRWSPAALARAVAMLDRADLVRPQNAFDPLPWHARWDTARSLVNRALGGDWPGTLVFRRSALPPDGYEPRVLFENLQLVRTVRAHGGAQLVARDLVVHRRPPTARRFWSQRVRQAYDSQAQPARALVELALLPAALAAARRPAWLVAGGALTVALAEAGRRRGGRVGWPATSALWAPLWVGERAVCAWLALALRLRGGVPYAGTVIRHAARPVGGGGSDARRRR